MEQHIRVLHLLKSSTFSGAENVVCQIIRMFNDDPSLEFAYCSPNGDISIELNKRGIKYIPLPSLTPRAVRRCIKSYKPDIVHAHDITASILASVATVGLKVKLISHVHVNNNNMARVNFKTVSYLLSCIRYNHIFFVAQSCYDCFAFRKQINRKSSVLTNVMDKNEIIRRANEADNKNVYDLVYVGRLTYQKNPEKLIRVISLIIKEIPTIRIGIVGQGDLLEITQRSANEKGLMDNVSFLGFISNPLGILSQAKLLLMTSRFEGLPMTVLESLALGIPIVSTPVDGLLDVVESGVNGFLVEDDLELANHAVALLKDDKKQKEMSNNAEESFDRISNVSHYKSELFKEYNTLLFKGKR